MSILEIINVTVDQEYNCDPAEVKYEPVDGSYPEGINEPNGMHSKYFSQIMAIMKCQFS